MTKICILTSAHASSSVRIFYKEAKSLKKAGYDVSLIVQHDNEEIIDGIRILPLNKPKNRFERMTKTTWQVYRKALKDNADIYHFHDPELIPIGLLLKLKGKPVIYDVHEDVPRQLLSKSYIPPIFRQAVSVFVEALEYFASKRFDYIITATPFIDNRFVKFGVDAINVNNFPMLSELYSTESQWDRKKLTVCYIGAIVKIRGIFEIVGAIEKTKCNLLLVGHLSSEIERQLRRMSGWHKVEALGFVDREGVKTAMALSIGGLVLFHPCPNHTNAQPNKLFEYMSAAIPVVASNFPLWRDIVEGSRCGLCVDPLNREKIAAAIQWLIENPSEAKRMGENGRRAVVKRYNWELEEKKLIGVYRRLSRNLP